MIADNEEKPKDIHQRFAAACFTSEAFMDVAKKYVELSFAQGEHQKKVITQYNPELAKILYK